MTQQWKINSKIGTLYLVASEKGLKGMFWTKQAAPMAKSLDGAAPEIKILSRTTAQLDEYLNGKRKKFDLPLDAAGTAFQQQVWQELSKIPYGETRSYKDIARRIRNPKAVRAVGGANGRNPVCIIVPCHRVIAADGSLGGYSGRPGVKSRLLELERALTISA